MTNLYPLLSVHTEKLCRYFLISPRALEIQNVTPQDTKEYKVIPGSRFEGEYVVKTYHLVGTDICVHEIWTKDGKAHRDGQPAAITRDADTGAIIYEHWKQHGRPHREDGPAVIAYDPHTGVLTREVWFRQGAFHRLDGPATITRDPTTGVVVQEKWWRDGWQHRDDGPSATFRDPVTGEVTDTEWNKMGRPIDAHRLIIIEPSP
jgi:hypothetical protein